MIKTLLTLFGLGVEKRGAANWHERFLKRIFSKNLQHNPTKNSFVKSYFQCIRWWRKKTLQKFVLRDFRHEVQFLKISLSQPDSRPLSIKAAFLMYLLMGEISLKLSKFLLRFFQAFCRLYCPPSYTHTSAHITLFINFCALIDGKCKPAKLNENCNYWNNHNY